LGTLKLQNPSAGPKVIASMFITQNGSSRSESSIVNKLSSMKKKQNIQQNLLPNSLILQPQTPMFSPQLYPPQSFPPPYSEQPQILMGSSVAETFANQIQKKKSKNNYTKISSN